LAFKQPTWRGKLCGLTAVVEPDGHKNTHTHAADGLLSGRKFQGEDIRKKMRQGKEEKSRGFLSPG